MEAPAYRFIGCAESVHQNEPKTETLIVWKNHRTTIAGYISNPWMRPVQRAHEGDRVRHSFKE